MTFQEICEEVTLRLKTADSRVLSKVEDFVNSAIGQIAIDVRLPNLLSFTSVTTSTSNAYVNLPDDFFGKLLYVGNSTYGKIDIEEKFDKFLEKHPDLTLSGDVTEVSLLGSVLYYSPIPTTATTLAVLFYKSPTTLTLSTDIPSCIPELLHRHTIVPLASAYGYDIIEAGDNNEKPNANGLRQEYEVGKTLLDTWCIRRNGSLSKSLWDI